MMKRVNEICKAFNKQASTYEKAARLQAETGQRLFERLQYFNIQPRRILDLGCGTGYFSQQLKQRFPKAQIVSCDLSAKMLEQVRTKHRWLNKWPLVQADMQQLPFASQSFDLIFSNQVIHWAESMPSLFSELYRVLNHQGCILFSTLGPDTFSELRNSFSAIDDYAHVNDFLDMHDIGDGMLQANFLDPVVDMEKLSVHFKSLTDLVRSLKDQGVKNIHSKRRRGLMTPRQWQSLTHAFESMKTEDGRYPLSYEVVYGHAWKNADRGIQRGNETVIPIRSIKRFVQREP